MYTVLIFKIYLILFFVVGIYYLHILLQTPMKFYKKKNTPAQS